MVIEIMNFHEEALKFREDIQGIFSSFSNMEPWNVIGKFTEYLERENCKIDNKSIYNYINVSIFPAWLIPYLFQFLSQEPYSSNPYVWTFIQKYSRPITNSLDTIRCQAEKRRQALLDEAKSMDDFI